MKRWMAGAALWTCAASPLWAATPAPVSAGRQIVMAGTSYGVPACSACHGSRLTGNPAAHVPGIAGRPATYVLQRLAHYAGPDGHNAQMKGVAASLTATDRQAVARYISTLRP